MRLLASLLLVAVAAGPAGAVDVQEIVGIMSVEPAYNGVCRTPLPPGLVLTPRLRGTSYDTRDPIYQTTDALIELLRQWTVGLARSGDPLGSHPVCAGLYDDVDEQGRASPNAFATSKSHILVGARMLERMTSAGFAGNRQAGLVFVLAHEFAHHVQYQNDQTFASYPTAMTAELQADCMAGYLLLFTSKRKKDSTHFYQRVYEMAASLGDEQVHDPQHHGTPEQRKNALMRGEAAAISDLMKQADSHPGQDLHPGSRGLLDACKIFPSDQQKSQAR